MRDYPLYEATYFNNFRVMIENAAAKFPNSTAFSYKDDPHSETVTKINFYEVKNIARNYGTALIDLGCRDAKCAIIGGTSIGWILTYFTVMAIGGVTVPCDKELGVEDLAGTVKRAECKFVFYGSDVAEKITAMKEECDGVEWICMNGEPQEGDRTRG